MGVCKGKWQWLSSLINSKEIAVRCSLVYEGAKGNIKQAPRNTSLTVKQEDRPEGRRLEVNHIKVTHEPMKVIGAVPWRLPALTRPRDSSSFLVLHLFYLPHRGCNSGSSLSCMDWLLSQPSVAQPLCNSYSSSLSMNNLQVSFRTN